MREHCDDAICLEMERERVRLHADLARTLTALDTILNNFVVEEYYTYPEVMAARAVLDDLRGADSDL